MIGMIERKEEKYKVYVSHGSVKASLW